MLWWNDWLFLVKVCCLDVCYYYYCYYWVLLLLLSLLPFVWWNKDSQYVPASSSHAEPCQSSVSIIRPAFQHSALYVTSKWTYYLQAAWWPVHGGRLPTKLAVTVDRVSRTELPLANTMPSTLRRNISKGQPGRFTGGVVYQLALCSCQLHMCSVAVH